MTPLRSVAVLSVLALAACSATTAGIRAGASGPDDGDTFAMVPGQTVSLSGEGALRYLRVVSDSRCLPDVQCVWAGDAELAFEWRPASGAADAFTLHTGRGAKSHTIGRHLLVLAGLGRGDAPQAELRLEAAP
jgi:hypothetical protein